MKFSSPGMLIAEREPKENMTISLTPFRRSRSQPLAVPRDASARQSFLFADEMVSNSIPHEAHMTMDTEKTLLAIRRDLKGRIFSHIRQVIRICFLRARLY